MCYLLLTHAALPHPAITHMLPPMPRRYPHATSSHPAITHMLPPHTPPLPTYCPVHILLPNLVLAVPYLSPKWLNYKCTLLWHQKAVPYCPTLPHDWLFSTDHDELLGPGAETGERVRLEQLPSLLKHYHTRGDLRVLKQILGERRKGTGMSPNRGTKQPT